MRAVRIYGAMFGGTMLGQLIGIAIDVLIERRIVALPLGLSMLLAGLFGARAAGRPLERAERWHVAIVYTLALSAVTLLLALWARASAGFFAVSPTFPLVAIGAMALCAMVCFASLTLFAPRRRSHDGRCLRASGR